MGKKQVKTETPAEALKTAEVVDTAVAKATSSSAKKLQKGRAYIKATYNNTIVSVTDDRGNLVAWSTAGSLGFAGPKKATPFAASKIVATLTEKLKKSGPSDISVFVNGSGGGRDSAIRSFINQGFNVLSITDVTPIPHNGVKAPKPRRI
jgi:small subunit ribosomal protein S11